MPPSPAGEPPPEPVGPVPARAAPAPSLLSAPPVQGRLTDLEIKDAQLIFGAVWQDLEADFGRQNLRFPKEIILLGGAPGAGKGTNTAFISKVRGLTCDPIIISALLDSPDAKRLKDAGNMVGDREVVSLLFRRLLRPEYRDGVILDGFPRTKTQVECLKLLVDRMHELRREFYSTGFGLHFRQPTIHIMVLFVDERTSVERQLRRGREIRAYNEEVARTGIGETREERPTDFNPVLAQRRYRVFKEQTWDALQDLKEIFHYHFIDAQGSLEEVERNIVKELEYQSTLELDPLTVDRLRAVPVASEIVVHARQELVKRLDGYEREQTALFERVVTFIEKKILPIVLRHAISGFALVNTEDPVLDGPFALAMLIDVFSERGYHAVVDLHRIEVPEAVDLKSGEVRCRVKKVHRIQIRFQGSEIRRG
ncbi:MAG: nucleoside monophosphate kinase [Opitutaceae bacterium]